MVSIAEQAKNFLQPLSESTTATAPRSTTPPVENPTVIPAGDDLQDSEGMLVEESAGDEEPPRLTGSSMTLLMALLIEAE